jgi:hypothetical protein
MPALSPESRRLFEVGRTGHAAPSGAKERTRRRLVHAMAGAASVGTLAAAKSAVAAWSSVAILLTSAASTGYFARELFGEHTTRQPSENRPAAARSPARKEGVGVADPASPQPALASLPVRGDARVDAETSGVGEDKKPAPPPAAPAIALATAPIRPPLTTTAAAADEISAQSSSDLARETAMIRDAHRALVAHDAVRALKLLDQHAALFPNARLEQERAAAHLLAQCQLGNGDAAQRAWGQFLTHWPQSPLLERLRSGCHVNGVELGLSR